MTEMPVLPHVVRSERSLQEFLRWNVARNLTIKKSGPNQWSCFIETCDSVEDARTNEGIPKTVVIDTGLIYRYSPGGRHGILEGPGLRDLTSGGKAGYRSLAQAAEKALLPDLFERLVRVSVVEVAMSPLQSILTDLATFGQVETAGAARAYRSRSNLPAYIALLDDLGYAKREGELLVPGRAFEDARKTRTDEDTAIHWMMGDILLKRGTYMREVLHWSMMVPYLRWTNSYYWRALEANKLPLMSLEGLKVSYSGIYGTPTHGHPMTQIMRLARAGILNKRPGNQYEGEEEVFTPYSQRASELPIVANALQLAAG